MEYEKWPELSNLWPVSKDEFRKNKYGNKYVITRIFDTIIFEAKDIYLRNQCFTMAVQSFIMEFQKKNSEQMFYYGNQKKRKLRKNVLLRKQKKENSEKCFITETKKKEKIRNTVLLWKSKKQQLRNNVLLWNSNKKPQGKKKTHTETNPVRDNRNICTHRRVLILVE